MDNCENFFETVKNHIPVIDDDFKDNCVTSSTIKDIESALFSMKRRKSHFPLNFTFISGI